MTIIDMLSEGVAVTNKDEAAGEMLADFTDHKVGMQLEESAVTIVVSDGAVALEQGIRADCHAVMKLSAVDLCEAIDNSCDLMEIREKGELLKGDINDPGIAVHFMATFPLFDAMVRYYEENEDFKHRVDTLKKSLKDEV